MTDRKDESRKGKPRTKARAAGKQEKAAEGHVLLVSARHASVQVSETVAPPDGLTVVFEPLSGGYGMAEVPEAVASFLVSIARDPMEYMIVDENSPLLVEEPAGRGPHVGNVVPGTERPGHALPTPEEPPLEKPPPGTEPPLGGSREVEEEDEDEDKPEGPGASGGRGRRGRR